MHFPQSALHVLERGGLVVTANARAARDLRRLYNELQRRESGKAAWESPAILDWTSWLDQQWQQLLLSGTEERLLLSPLQEEVLWAEIVSPVVERRSLIAPKEVAKLARGAYSRLATYGGLARLKDGEWGARTHDTEAQEPELFRRWALDFERVCSRRGWLSASLLPWVIATALRDGHVMAPAVVGWLGFDRKTPALEELQAVLRSQECEEVAVSWDLRADERRVSAATVKDEIEACAEWTRGILEQRENVRVGILLQDADAMRAQIDRVFRRVLMPKSQGLTPAPEKPVYEFTLGMPLGDIPLAKAAILLLQWVSRPLEQEQISWLLTSGFIGDAQDGTGRAAVDARLRRAELVPPEQGMGELLLRLADPGSSSGAGQWEMLLGKARNGLAKLLDRERSCRQWADAVQTFLNTAGWPGARARDSVNFQVYERWQRLLEEVARLDVTETRLSFARFVEHVSAHARDSIFSAESDDAPVTISGVLESAGRAFDAVWMVGATDDTWPAKSAPHPLLPRWLQRELGMPRGDAAEDTLFGAQLMDRLRASCSAVVTSYAMEGATGAQRPSSLITEMRISAASTPVIEEREGALETFVDDGGIAWPGGQSAGGQSVLKKQAACPFQAFAAVRLGGKETRISEHGLNASQRGSLLHAVLETLWQDLEMRGSEGLWTATINGSLPELIAKHVGAALENYRQEGAWAGAYLKLEESRLQGLVSEWLSYEQGRTPFEVEMAEKNTLLEIAGLQLKVRLDRIDRLLPLEDGEPRRILIDYKTGVVKRPAFQMPRMDEPQLPLYAVAGNVDGLSDVFFALLRPEKLCFVDALNGDGSYLYPPREKPKLPEMDFASLIERWSEDLSTTSREFQDGVASVTPKDYPKTCKFCAFPGLCRVAETSIVAGDEDEE